MKKARILAVVAIVMLACAFVVYGYYTPDIRITISEPVDANAESYLEQVMVGVSTKFGLPPPRSIQANIRAFTQANEAVIRQLMQRYATPMRISTAVEVIDGQTIVRYAGTATTPEGDTANIDERLTFDFVLTHAISG